MKKVVALLLVLLTVFSLAACGTAAPRLERVPFEEIVVADNEQYKVVVTNIDARIHYVVEVLLENRGTETLSLSTDCFINGVSFTMTLPAGGFEPVEPGQEKSITFGIMDLREYSIGAITDVELQINVLTPAMGSNAWGVVSELDAVHFYPQGEENATIYELQPKENQPVIVDNEYVTVTVIGYGSLCETKLHIVNHTDEALLVCAGHAELNRSIQGKASLFASVPAQSQGFGTLWPVYPGTDDGKVHNYIKTEFISFSLHVTGETVSYSSDTITLSPAGRKVEE